MNPDRIAEIREIVGWSRGTLADILDVSVDTVRHWESGRRTIPEHIAAWLEREAAWRASNPPPARPLNTPETQA